MRIVRKYIQQILKVTLIMFGSVYILYIYILLVHERNHSNTKEVMLGSVWIAILK